MTRKIQIYKENYTGNILLRLSWLIEKSLTKKKIKNLEAQKDKFSS
jgi:hypothetical protein